MGTLKAEILPVPDVQETDRLEIAAQGLFKAHIYEAALTICEQAVGAADHSRLRVDSARYVVERVLGPIKGPAGDWVEDFLKDVRNPISSVGNE